MTSSHAAILESIAALDFSRAFPAKSASRCPLTGMRVYPGDQMRRLGCGAYIPNATIALIGPFRAAIAPDFVTSTYDRIAPFDAAAAATHLSMGGTVHAIGPNGLKTWRTPASEKQLASRGRKMRLMVLA